MKKILLMLTIVAVSVALNNTLPAHAHTRQQGDEEIATRLAENVASAFGSRDIPRLQSEVDASLPALQRAGQAYPNNDRIQFALFVCYSVADQRPQALRAIGRAYHLKTDNTAYGINYALMLKRTGSPVMARQVLTAVSRARGNPPALRSMLAALELATQDYPSAIADLQSALAAVPDNEREDRSLLLSELGNAYLHQGEYGKAIEVLQRSIAAQERNTTAHSRLGEALLKSGKQRESIPHFDTALSQRPGMAEALYYKGIALAQLGYASGAKASYNRAVSAAQSEVTANPDSGRAWFVLSLAEGKTGQTAGSQKHRAEAKKRGYTYEAPFIGTKKG